MKTNTHIDVELIEAYKSGNQNAMAQLVKRWHVIFCKKAFWIVKDADLSKDIAQDSWQVIMEKLHVLQKPSSFKSWAFRIVYSKSLDALRQQQKEQVKGETYKREQISLEYNNEENDNALLKEKLLKAILTLPMQQQHIIKLFYVESYSLKEISDLLSISVGTVKSRLFHAREKLKLILKDKKNRY
ncbi:RNA polymerase sigma factor [uncultured Psychroserpens sp.]|uniref:RNA polymerase sigma factor n=1 Tax=uncultured Psychroserpens sp. TaxID=255436 RepID=UPI0026133DE1|nr:RNA polymerase sigma factor [uncultured Psychroserpens sp.]